MKLFISVDCGSSLTKILYRISKKSNENYDGYLVQKPLIEEVLAQRIEDFLNFTDSSEVADPNKQAYITVEKRSFVLGEFAEQLHVEETDFDKKYENGLYKTLAAIGVVLEKHQITKTDELEVWVSVLLPWNESRDKEIFKERFYKLSKSYKFRGQTIKLKLIPEWSLVVMTEGMGIAAGFMLENMSLFKDKKVGIAMFGYRNITGLTFENTYYKNGTSPKLGMSKFLDWVIERSSALERHSLLKIINKSIQEIEIDKYAIADHVIEHDGRHYAMSSFLEWDKLKAVQNLTSTVDPKLREREIKDQTKILETVSREYRARVRKWLQKTFPVEEFDYLFVSGGSVKFLRTEIEAHCNCYLMVDRDADDGSKYRFVENSLEDDRGANEYFAMGDSDEHIQLIGDRLLIDKVGSIYRIRDNDIEKMALDIRLVDNYGAMERLFSKERKYQAKLRSDRASKGGKAAQAARQKKDTSQTESVKNGDSEGHDERESA